jgi:hypothetical protein
MIKSAWLRSALFFLVSCAGMLAILGTSADSEDIDVTGCVNDTIQLSRYHYPSSAVTMGSSIEVLAHLTCDVPEESIAYGDVVGETVTWTVVAGGGTVGGDASTSSRTEQYGNARVIWDVGQSPGQHRLIASYCCNKGKTLTVEFKLAVKPI